MGRLMKLSPTTPAAAARGPVRSHAGPAPAASPLVAFRSLMLGEAKPRVASEPGRALAAPTPQCGRRPAPREACEPPAVDPGALEPRDEREAPARGEDLRLDPSARHSAQLAPPMQPLEPLAAEVAKVEVARRGSLEELLPALVRRIAWGGDTRRGSVRIELGAGELAGGTVVVHADDGRVRVELTVPRGVDAGVWHDRIERRLAARGLDVASVDVR